MLLAKLLRCDVTLGIQGCSSSCTNCNRGICA